jgi:hypothetical protein
MSQASNFILRDGNRIVGTFLEHEHGIVRRPNSTETFKCCNCGLTYLTIWGKMFQCVSENCSYEVCDDCVYAAYPERRRKRIEDAAAAAIKYAAEEAEKILKATERAAARAAALSSLKPKEIKEKIMVLKKNYTRRIIKYEYHEHKLYKRIPTYTSGDYECYKCSNVYKCDKNEPAWQCRLCMYDVCGTCIFSDIVADNEIKKKNNVPVPKDDVKNDVKNDKASDRI